MPEYPRDQLTYVTTKLEEIERSQLRIEKRLDTLDEHFSNEYVTFKEFNPVRNVVYGMVAVILLGFLSAVVAFFFARK